MTQYSHVQCRRNSLPASRPIINDCHCSPKSRSFPLHFQWPVPLKSVLDKEESDQGGQKRSSIERCGDPAIDGRILVLLPHTLIPVLKRFRAGDIVRFWQSNIFDQYAAVCVEECPEQHLCANKRIIIPYTYLLTIPRLLPR